MSVITTNITMADCRMLYSHTQKNTTEKYLLRCRLILLKPISTLAGSAWINGAVLPSCQLVNVKKMCPFDVVKCLFTIKQLTFNLRLF